MGPEARPPPSSPNCSTPPSVGFTVARRLCAQAFVHAVSDAAQLRAQNKWLLLFSLGNLLAVVALQRPLGTGAKP